MKPVGFYSSCYAAKEIENVFGMTAEKLTDQQIRGAIALCAPDDSEIFCGLYQFLKQFGDYYLNPGLLYILDAASESDRLDLLPFFVEVLRDRS